MAILPHLIFFLSFLHGGAALQRQSLAVIPPSLPAPLLEENDQGGRDTAFPFLRLHHRDSLMHLLPVGSTPESLLLLRLERDAARAAALESRAAGSGLRGDVVSGLPQGSGEYFTRLGIGTPPIPASMVLDTGSDIVWVQCAPCLLCYSQSDPLFYPNNSRSFAAVPCGAPLCRRLHPAGCTRLCLYRVTYGDGSLSVGDFATETLTFDGGSKVPSVGFGCGHANSGLFVGAAGVLGLGRGELSFPSQIATKYSRRFSYCLVDRISGGNGTSTLLFGSPAAASAAAVFTPMLVNPKAESFYYVELTGISVGGKKVAGVKAEDFLLDTATGKGGVVVDSGTSVTRLVEPAYAALRDAFRDGAKELGNTRNFSLFDTCYDLKGMTEVRIPTLVFHFGGDGGADMVLPAANYMVPVNSDPVFCFAFASSSDLSIIGNIQQQGFRVIFDGVGSRVGFIPNSC